MATSSSLLFSVTLRCPCHGRSLSWSPSAGSGASGSPCVRLQQRSGNPALWAGTSLCFPASPLTVFAKLESEWERVDQRGRGARHRGVGCCPLMRLLHPPTCGPGPSRVCTSPPHATRRRELTSPGTSVHGRFLASPGPRSPQKHGQFISRVFLGTMGVFRLLPHPAGRRSATFLPSFCFASKVLRLRWETN